MLWSGSDTLCIAVLKNNGPASFDSQEPLHYATLFKKKQKKTNKQTYLSNLT